MSSVTSYHQNGRRFLNKNFVHGITGILSPTEYHGFRHRILNTNLLFQKIRQNQLSLCQPLVTSSRSLVIRFKKSLKKRKIEEDEFDPMDPSSYSDAPRGGWGVGLKK